jgi:hypothetical protein
MRPCGVARPERLCAAVGGATLTTLTFTNGTGSPSGTLEICKVAGTGIAPGMSFTFAVRDTAGAAATSVVVPAGQCVAAGTFGDGASVEVTEAPAGGSDVIARAVLPAERLAICAQPQANRICARVTGGATTQVRFTNAVPQGQLKVCKIAGDGVAPGTSFTFAVRDAARDTPASVVVPAGQCVLAGLFAEGATVEVTETVPVGIEVSDRQVTPIQWLQTCAAPQSNRACARIGGGQVTHVTFTDRKPPTGPRANVKICKVAGSAGITGTYSFGVRALPSGTVQTYAVAVGACVTIPNLSVSTTLEVTEAVPAGQTAVMTVDPAEEERPCPTRAVGRACINVSSGGTKVTATNTKLGTASASLHLCKVAGAGVANGVPFSFSVRMVANGQTVSQTVATGDCATVPGIPGDTTVEVTETLPSGFVLPPLIAVDPASAGRTCTTPQPTRACANAAAGTTVELRFTNRVPG